MAGYLLCVGCGAGNSDRLGDLSTIQAEAGRGNAESQFTLGDYFFQGKAGLPLDHVQAVKWLRLAADQGHADAQVRLGVCYADGKGVAADSAEEVKWYRLAAQQGHPRAQANLATCYLVGKGVPQDKVESFKWYTLAMKGGAAGAEMMRRNIVLSPAQRADAERKIGEFAPDRTGRRAL